MAKKAVKKKKRIVTRATPKALPAMSSCNHGGMGGEMVLCKLSLIAAIFFLMTVPGPGGNGLASLILGVSWWAWLLLAIVIGLKPMMRHLKR